MGVVFRGAGVRSQQAGWWCRPARLSRVEALHSVVPSMICWHIWLAQNLALFEGQVLRRKTICDRILADVVGLVSGQVTGESDGDASWPAFYARMSD